MDHFGALYLLNHSITFLKEIKDYKDTKLHLEISSHFKKKDRNYRSKKLNKRSNSFPASQLESFLLEIWPIREFSFFITI